MKGSLWRKNTAAAQFKSLWYFSNRKVNAFIYGPKKAVLDDPQAWQIGNYGRFSENAGEHIRPAYVQRPGLGRLAIVNFRSSGKPCAICG